MTVVQDRNGKVKGYIKGLALKDKCLVQLAADLRVVADKYRNGAAHTSSLGRAELDEFRRLLFEDGLLSRIAQLSRAVESHRKGS